MELTEPVAARRTILLFKSQCRALGRLHHALERHVVLTGKTGAILVLGRRTLTAVGQGGYFDGNLAPRRRYALKAAWQANALHDLAADGIGRGFQKIIVCRRSISSWVQITCNCQPGRPFLQ